MDPPDAALNINKLQQLAGIDSLPSVPRANRFPSSQSLHFQGNRPRHRAPVVSDWFLEHDGEVGLVRRPPQSPGPSPTQFLIMGVMLSCQYGPATNE